METYILKVYQEKASAVQLFPLSIKTVCVYYPLKNVLRHERSLMTKKPARKIAGFFSCAGHGTYVGG